MPRLIEINGLCLAIVGVKVWRKHLSKKLAKWSQRVRVIAARCGRIGEIQRLVCSPLHCQVQNVDCGHARVRAPQFKRGAHNSQCFMIRHGPV